MNVILDFLQEKFKQALSIFSCNSVIDINVMAAGEQELGVSY